MIALTLPYPPSVNHYWRHTRNGHYIAEAGKAYRTAVLKAMALRPHQTLAGTLAVLIDAYPPDRRTRDADNLSKAVLDSLTHAGLWHDDSQVMDLRIIRRPPEGPPGAVVVKISELQEMT